MSKQPQILIVDFGSQTTTLIGRTLAELGYHSEIVPPEKLTEKLEENAVKAIILSGGDKSVYDVGAPDIPDEILDGSYYVLGICYGMQLIAHKMNPGSVQRGPKEHRGYGPHTLYRESEKTLFSDQLFRGVPHTLDVWTSHGDIVSKMPEGFYKTAHSENGALGGIEAMENSEQKIFGVQFHPEVIQTKDNNRILQNFAEIAGCVKDWIPSDVIKSIQDDVVHHVGSGKAFLGVSGGVDSTTLASILTPVLGDKLYACFIDHGGMRDNEPQEVAAVAKKAGIDLHVVHAADDFFETIGGAIDPEEKRKRFQAAYQSTFEKIIRKENITHILQGTLATDLIESGHKGKSAHIKTHHNVGLSFSVPEIQPLQHLFKYEVRALARTLKLDNAIAERKPFPGPGLYLRVLGFPVTRERIELVQWAEGIVTNILKDEKCFDEISQLIVALGNIETVGVKGDGRTLLPTIFVRTVKTSDFMTVEPFYPPTTAIGKITNAITKHEKVNRVVWDFTPKPPATTEFQ